MYTVFDLVMRPPWDTMNKPISMHSLRWFVWSLALSVGTFLATAAVMSIPVNTRGIDVASGRDLFRAHCGSCHFAKVGFPAHHGPNLHDIGHSGASRKPNQSAAEYILESILDPSSVIAPSGRPGMPPNVGSELDPNDVRNIVGFLASCGAFPDYDKIMSLEIPDRRSDQTETTLIRLKDMQLAEHVLREKGMCLECHSLHSVPETKIHAPGLFGVGLSNKEAIHESVLDPHKEIKPKYASVTVVLENGLVVSGQLLSRTDARLVLCSRGEQNRLVLRDIPLADIEREDGRLQILESKISLMPTGFGKILTSEEIEAVINLIRQLN
jgi:putative heme-binding domain-containing protein